MLKIWEQLRSMVKTYFAAIHQILIKWQYGFEVDRTQLRATQLRSTHSAKILIINKEGIIEKTSFERRAYESG